MADASWFTDLPADFEESVRIDRDERDHRRRAIQSYHVTADSQRVIRDFGDRMLGQADDMRTGSNYWLYGYYGSGKSHLLTVLDGLLDSDWLDGQYNDVWDDLTQVTEDTSVDQLRDHWRRIHEEYYVIPVSINLLKYQGQKQRSFSEIVLRHAHQDPDLTGVDDEISSGLSSQLDVAYFEKWLRTTEVWPNRQTRAKAVLETVTAESGEYDWDSETLWEDIQKYGALADVVLPKLFEEINEIPDGYTDLVPSDIDAKEVVRRLNQLRENREREHGTPVKLVLLLDEVSLFIGTDFERLTELQTLAEHIDEVDNGDIQLVVTAQANIEDTQPKFAAHGADFTILKDRFPHRYPLPSKHVGEIAKRRLFEKSDQGEARVNEVLDEASVKPTESLIYNEIKQNTKPPLDSIDDEELVEFYPFLPYHAPLFLEILFNLRQEASDPAKSIFSGTARAILALMHNLLQRWVEEGNPDHVVTLVDFYELVKPELREILTQDMRVIEGSDATRGIADEVEDGSLEPFDLDVAKAVLLLQHVHDIVPMNEGNIAVSVMSDLNGRSWISTQNRVEESLARLQKFIRPTAEESGARYRFATQEERRIYEDAEKNQEDPDWEAIVQTLDTHLWAQIIQELSLPESVPYDAGEEYPVTYEFSLDGTGFETASEAEGGLEVAISVRGVHPNHTPEKRDEKTLYWEIDTDGLDDLRKHVVEWWALRDAISRRSTPPPVERDLDRRASAVRSKLVSAMQRGSYTVKDRTDIKSLSTAVEAAVKAGDEDEWHPMMNQVTADRLQELIALGTQEPLPQWAHKIQVPSSDIAEKSGRKTIQSNILSLTGRQLQGQKNGLNMNTVLDGIISEKPFLEGVRPALCAILWGFCQEGRLVPVDEDGNTLANEVILDQNQLSTTRLKLLPREPIGKILEDGGFKETTETVADGLINLQEANTQLRSALTGLQEDVQLVADTDIRSDAIAGLLSALVEELSARIDATTERLAVVRSQGAGLRDAVEQTNDEQEWLDEVVDVWNRRLVSLYRYDVALLVGASEFTWIDANAQSLVTEQRAALSAFDGDWWTIEGWKVLVEKTATGCSGDLQRAWDEYVDENRLAIFVDRLEAHPWIVPATELPSSVHAAFERTYITPFRELRRWYETVDRTVTALTSADEETLASAADDITNVEPPRDAVENNVDALESRLDRLSTIVGDRTPENVDQIGVLPEDRQGIDRRLERLVERRELAVEIADSGVIIR